MRKIDPVILTVALLVFLFSPVTPEIDAQQPVPCIVLGIPTLCPPPCPGCVSVRIVATRFEVHTGTIEGHLLRDGRGDEVFIASNVAELTARNSLLGPVSHKRTAFYGDTDGRGTPATPFTGLEHPVSTSCNFIVKAGRGSVTSGGLLSGNVFPDPTVTDSRRPWDSCNGKLIPFTLWQGQLRPQPDPTAVVIFPTIWENDYQQEIYNIWNSQAAAWLSRYAANSKPDVLGMRTARMELVRREQVVLRTVPNRNDFDRPIGIDGAPYDPFPAQRVDAEFAPFSVFLTAATVDAAVARGEFGIRYNDGSRYGPGDYTLFVRVERL